MILVHKFVDKIPENIEEGVIYISIECETAIHKCCCGCGMEVVTPLSPTDWTLIFDGVSVSLDPSIGNWSFDCHSHYWIRKNEVIWSGSWNTRKINDKRKEELETKLQYYNKPDGLMTAAKPKQRNGRKKKARKAKGAKSIFSGKRSNN
ncbi:MAG TPA: DUF6527 family protein [Hanamia sp.]|nr:hypothetical protein [Bacteroidota bacterium]HUZ60314.1 DUF6527 family protein [Hanamia sp.]